MQQFLVQGLVAGNLVEAGGWVSSPFFVIPATAGVFASVHLPNLGLTAGTFALGLGYTPIYLQHRNLWPLGLYHGWLGALYYHWVLDQNPWRELWERRSDAGR
jgi:membrane protease YdiL (CAAX protease family)